MGLRFNFSEDGDIKISGLLGDAIIHYGFAPVVRVDDYPHPLIDADHVELSKAQVLKVAEYMRNVLAIEGSDYPRAELEWFKVGVLDEWLKAATDESTMLFA